MAVEVQDVTVEALVGASNPTVQIRDVTVETLWSDVNLASGPSDVAKVGGTSIEDIAAIGGTDIADIESIG